MATAAQILANRTNAQKSTGPTTSAGKLTARMNAFKHGITGQLILLTPEEDAEYQRFSVQMMTDLQPANAVEYSFAARIVHDTWRIEHAHSVERNLESLPGPEVPNVISLDANGNQAPGEAAIDASLNQALAFEARQKTFALLSLYTARIQRGIHQDLAMLYQMQKQRRTDPYAAQRAALAAEADFKPTIRPATKATETTAKPTRSETIGSVFSTPPSASAPQPDHASDAPETMAA